MKNNKNSINMQKTCIVNCIEANVLYEILIKTNNVFTKRSSDNLEKMIADSKKFYKKLIALDEELERIAKSNNLKYRKGILLDTIKNSYFGEDKC